MHTFVMPRHPCTQKISIEAAIICVGILTCQELLHLKWWIKHSRLQLFVTSSWGLQNDRWNLQFDCQSWCCVTLWKPSMFPLWKSKSTSILLFYVYQTKITCTSPWRHPWFIGIALHIRRTCQIGWTINHCLQDIVKACKFCSRAWCSLCTKIYIREYQHSIAGSVVVWSRHHRKRVCIHDH